MNKNVIVEEELDGIDRDDIENLKDLPRLVLIDEECWNPKVVDGGDLARILTKRSQTFYKPVDVRSVTYAIGESISSISIWNIMNQLGKYNFSSGSVVNNLKERHHFSELMNRNRFDLILARRYWNCSAIENLRCLNSAVNKTI